MSVLSEAVHDIAKEHVNSWKQIFGVSLSDAAADGLATRLVSMFKSGQTSYTECDGCRERVIREREYAKHVMSDKRLPRELRGMAARWLDDNA